VAFRKKDDPSVKKVVQMFGARDGEGSAAAAEPVRTNGALHIADSGAESRRKPVKISTVSHTLEAEIAEKLRHFAFRERISESAVIEFSLRELFADGDESELGRRLRDAGAALRRRS